MRRLLALEWNGSEARAAVASSRGGRVVLEHAFCIPLAGAAGDATSEEGVGQRIATALEARRIGRLDTLVAVGRSRVELRQLSLPPVPDEELPDLVRFQALREFSALDEDWPLDYLPLDEDPTQARNVLAAAISPHLVEEIREGCRAAGLPLARLTLRPVGAASLVLRRPAGPEAEVRLLVDLLPGEADLTVLVGRKIVFLRCARLSGDPLADAAQALVAEIRLTMAAAQNQLAGKPVQQIVLFGTGSSYAALAQSLEKQLLAPTVLFDPFEGLTPGSGLREAPPPQPDRFAGLLGMLLTELSGEPQAFDFLHPRRRPEPPNRRNTYLLAGLTVALLVLLVFFGGWYRQSRLRDELLRLQAESKSLDKKVTQAEKLEKAAAEIDTWLSGEIVWLDELRWLSQKFPAAEQAMLTQLKMTAGNDHGEMILDGLARDVDAVTRLDSGLHDERHRVAGKTKGEYESGGRYTVQFRSSLLITPQKP